jgi:hypothetical protein
MSKRPSPRLASAQDASTSACPRIARPTARWSSDAAIAIPIGTKRRFSRLPAMIAGNAPPPADSTASAANCAEPANTITDITIVATAPSTGRASTPNERPSRNEAIA